MSRQTQQLTLRANALYIGIAGAAGVIFDLRGAWYGLGPQGRVLANAPHAAIGFVEAHGLAVILAVLLWRAVPSRSWHLAAAAMVALLGTSNLIFWPLFAASDALALGYVTTALHWIFFVLQISAATVTAERTASRTALLRS